MEVGDAATNQRGRAGFHEPGHSSSSSFSSSSSTIHPVWTFSRTRRTTRTRTNQFMVPMHARKRKEAFHEPRRSRREEALISSREHVSLLTSAPTRNQSRLRKQMEKTFAGRLTTFTRH